MNIYQVTFVGDYFTLTTRVDLDTSEPDLEDKTDDELLEVAEQFAYDLLRYQYGWDMNQLATVDVTVEEAGVTA